MNDELEKTWKESPVIYFKIFPHCFPEGLRKLAKYLSMSRLNSETCGYESSITRKFFRIDNTYTSTLQYTRTL